MGTAVKNKELTGRHVLLLLVAFFGVIIAVNAVFIVAAVKSFTGEDVHGSYRQGLEYNTRIERRATEQTLGWNVRGNVVQSGGTALIFAVDDQNGTPLTGLEIEGVLRHPTDRVFDKPVSFQSGTSGTYKASLNAQPAHWRFIGAAHQGENVFRFEYDVTIE